MLTTIIVVPLVMLLWGVLIVISDRGKYPSGDEFSEEEE
jgi:hypothetical protein